MRPRIVKLLVWRELRASLRGRWFLVGTASFALLAVAVARLGMGDASRWGVSTLDRSTVALLNLVFLYVPLLTLPLGAASFSGEAEDGTLGYLIAQPITRAEVFAGKLLGLITSMTLSIAIGFGAAAIAVGSAGSIASSTFAVLVAGAWLLGATMTAIGVLLAMAARTRVRALAAAMGAWLVFVFLCDFGVLALASSQAVGPDALFALSVANPIQAIKTLVALFVTTRLEVLGPVGVHAVHELGRGVLAAVLIGTTVGWAALAGGAGYALFRRENLA